MIRTDPPGTWGHDQVLRRFFMHRGVPRAEELPCLEGIAIEEVGAPLPDYQAYLEKYEIAKKPAVAANPW